MSKPGILVTGATGKTGSVVVTELLKAGYPVRAMVRREDSRSARLRAKGAEIAVAAQWLASPSHPSLMTRQHWLADRLFSVTPGVAHTLVNAGFFADAYLATTGFAAHVGVFPWIYGNSRNAPPSNEDIARIAVAALMNPTRHGGKSYRTTGPALLGAGYMAKAIGRAVGRSVRAEPTLQPADSRQLASPVRAVHDGLLSALVTISPATTGNCAVRSRPSRSLRPSPRSGGGSTPLAASPGPARRAARRHRATIVPGEPL